MNIKPLSGNKIMAIGTMSGTSLDGLDIAAVEFKFTNGSWSFKIVASRTYSYSKNWLEKLKKAPTLSGIKLTELHSEYGNYLGNKINGFLVKNKIKPDIIASHGHTIFHRPEKQFTLQIGNGAEIAAITGIPTIADFRISDIALGGQGAPLVPIGDKYLFSEYKYCLNLGGFSNISFDKNNERIAFDICPVNFALNHYAERQGMAFDKDGKLGKSGTINQELLTDLNNLAFYEQPAPKSLGREWMEEMFFPILESYKIPDKDKMRTLYEHIAIQISKIGDSGKLLITGGGAFNTFLIERIKHHSSLEIIIPSKEIIDFKEALIFAFLGVLKINNKINCLSSVTGASQDSSSGIIFTI